MSDVHREFFEANAGALNTIVIESQRFIDESPDPIVVERHGLTGEPMLTGGANEPEDLLPRYSHRPDEEAMEVAQYVANSKNMVARHRGAVKFNGLVTMASMHHAIELYDAGLLDPTDPSTREFLDYRLGTFHLAGAIVDNETQVMEVGHVRLHDLEIYDSADQHQVELVDELGLSRKLSITYLGLLVTDVTVNTQMHDDPLLQRCTKLMGFDADIVTSIMVGRHDNDEELDEAIATVWLSYQGTSLEQEITPLLDEVRDRAVAAKQAHNLSYEHASNLPSAQQLDEFVDILKSA